MMEVWLTYSLDDFMMFSPATYFRLLERHNSALWPLHVLTLGVGCGIPIVLRTRWRHRHLVVGLLLAACWLWVAWSFLLGPYATINWAAPWLAGVFAAQAAVFLLVGFGGGRLGVGGVRGRGDVGIFLLFLLSQPVLGLLSGRPMAQAEVFGILPDPTAMAALGSALLAPRPTAWLLFPLPALWCLIAGATLWAMEAPDALVPFAATAVGLALLVMPGRGGK